MTDRPDLLSAKNISKRFYATQALDRVSFDLVRGEVHTLVGEKGGIIITGMNVVPPALAAVAKGEVEMTGMQPGGKNGPIARGEKVRASGGASRSRGNSRDSGPGDPPPFAQASRPGSGMTQ